MGADTVLSATWDEHGEWMAALFEIDADAVIGPYDGRRDFHNQTRNAYLTEGSLQRALVHIA